MKKDSLYLSHILNSLQRIIDFTNQEKKRFLNDILIQDAVYRNLQIIGEAAKLVSKATCQKTPHIPWRRIAGLRDIIVHQYDGVDPEKVWKIIEDDIPSFKKEINFLLENLSQEDV